MSKNIEKNLSNELSNENEKPKELIKKVLEQAQVALDNLELLSAASKLAGIQVPPQADLSFKIAKGFVKSATILTTKERKELGLSNAFDIGVGFALPSARAMGLSAAPAMNHYGKAAQLTAKLRDKVMKGDKLVTANTLGNVLQIHGSLSSNKFAPYSGPLGRISTVAHKMTKKNSFSRSKYEKLNHYEERKRKKNKDKKKI